MPALGPWRSLARATLAAALAALLAPGLVSPASDLGPAVVRELAVGLTLGLTATLSFYAAELAGRTLDAAIDPRTPGPFSSGRLFHGERRLLGDAYRLFSVAIFCALGGFEAILAALGESYAALPPSEPTPGTARVAVEVGARLVVCGAGVAAPVLAALLVLDLGAVLLARAQPLVGELLAHSATRRMAGVALMALALFSAERQLERAPKGGLASVSAAFRAALGALGRPLP
jgi:type III secretory pathway component EscT